jgi:hypothetical protein
MIKKLLIGASALALATGVAGAQTYYGKKDGQTASSDIGPPTIGNNNSSVVQNSNANLADVNQIDGTHNNSSVTQGLNGVAGSGDNRAEVKQSGTGANAAKVTQIGTDRDNSSFLPGAFPGPNSSLRQGTECRHHPEQQCWLEQQRQHQRIAP